MANKDKIPEDLKKAFNYWYNDTKTIASEDPKFITDYILELIPQEFLELRLLKLKEGGFEL